MKPQPLRPILPRERTIVDRLIDALVGDGPDRRYALICQECSAHNGMALQEEFEYLGKGIAQNHRFLLCCMLISFC